MTLPSGSPPPDGRTFSADLLRIALRHGVATSTGIAVSAPDASALGWSDDIRRTGADAAGALAAIGDVQALEDVRTSIESGAAIAEAHLAEALSAPVKLDLAEHWTNLGGRLPEKS